EAIRLPRLNYLLTFTPDALQILQVFILGNDGQETYVGDEAGQTFLFSLPEDVTNIQFQDNIDNRFLALENGYANTAPILPGLESQSIVVVYSLPYAEDSVTLEFPLPDNIETMNFLMQDIGVNLTSDQLQLVDSREVEGQQFVFYNKNFNQAEMLTVALENLGQLKIGTEAEAEIVPPTPIVDQDLLLWIIAGMAALAAVLAGVGYPYYRPQRAIATRSDTEIAAERQTLLQTLAHLDDIFEAGKLSEAVYQRARTAYKAKLATLVTPDDD
ncbi:MAG: hypothetical protein AAF485_18875, partial [Chloroflexota bacterium]